MLFFFSSTSISDGANWNDSTRNRMLGDRTFAFGSRLTYSMISGAARCTYS